MWKVLRQSRNKTSQHDEGYSFVKFSYMKKKSNKNIQWRRLRNQEGTLEWRSWFPSQTSQGRAEPRVWENEHAVKSWSVIINWAILHRPSSLHSAFSLKSMTFYVSLNCWITTVNWIEHPSPPCWCNQTRLTLHSRSPWLAFSSAIGVEPLGAGKVYKACIQA